VRSLHGIYTHGFPNLFLVAGLRQGSPTVNNLYMTGEQAFHAAEVVKRVLKDKIKIMEVTREAEVRWCEIISAKSRVNVEYIRACTPSFLNAEGDISELPKQAFPTAYGGGPFEYLDILKDWRERRLVDDLQLTRE
jgi:cyclohexanone monooxygenase